MFSAIDNPRYVFVKKGLGGRKSYSKSYSCPGILAGNKETAELLGRNIEKIMGKYYLIYTRTEQGNFLLHARPPFITPVLSFYL